MAAIPKAVQAKFLTISSFCCYATNDYDTCNRYLWYIDCSRHTSYQNIYLKTRVLVAGTK